MATPTNYTADPRPSPPTTIASRRLGRCNGSSSSSGGSSGGGGSSFTANTAVFDGGPDALKITTALVGGSDSKTFTFSCWVKFSDDDGANRFILVRATNFYIYVNASNRIELYGLNTSGSECLFVTGTSTTINVAGGYYHIYVNWDMANQANCKIRINGVVEPFAVTTFTVNAILDIDGNSWNIATDGLSQHGMTLAEMWFGMANIDNLAAFYSGGHPVSLGPTGALPGTPVFYLSRNGSGDSWAIDSSGNGNNWNVFGPLGTGTAP